MEFPKGVTGFYNEKHNMPPTIDRKQFKQQCFSIIKRNNGKVLEFIEPQFPTNFLNVEVKVFNKHLHILLNEHYPFLAFASFVDFENIKFIDEPELLKQFSPFYRVLSMEELNKPLYIKDSTGKIILVNDNELNSTELEQIAYWKPKSYGEVIFNFWD
ncbi:hypothetical protein [Peribacillus frigoritolerans]|uniref:hypothetical protein n=1 Tax=Peribacillus frigoritolerans TaxID=450367 RepID=UPI002E1CC255|nr:hypothetical protein [Peribacillus frigoritolerans]